MKIVDITKKREIIKAVIIFSLIVLTIALLGFAYARYITMINGNTSADIAKWSFKVYDGLTHTESIENLSITRTDNNQEVEEGMIAPRNLWKISNRH